MLDCAIDNPASVDPGELARVKNRVQEFERLYQHMQGRAPAMRNYPDLWPRYVRAMSSAAQARTRVHQIAGLADNGYHYAQAALGRDLAQQGLGELGFWPQLLTLGVLGVLTMLGPPAMEMAQVAKCAELADKLRSEKPGLKPDQALRIACPHLYRQTLGESLAKVALYGSIIVGGIYLINRNTAKSAAGRYR